MSYYCILKMYNFNLYECSRFCERNICFYFLAPQISTKVYNKNIYAILLKTISAIANMYRN